MSLKNIAAALVVAVLGVSSASADVIGAWAQNSNTLTLGGFGFELGDFPQAADVGVGTYNPSNFDATVDVFDVYQEIDSFSGTSTNDKNGLGSGGSFSFIGDGNNGAIGTWSVPTTGFKDIEISWAQRGTSTGYNSRTFEYSLDGGANWVGVPFSGDSGALPSSWATVNIDLTSVSGLDSNADAQFRLIYDGASSGSGNNRWDNFYVEGTVIPEPTSMVLFAGGLLAIALRRNRG